MDSWNKGTNVNSDSMTSSKKPYLGLITGAFWHINGNLHTESYRSTAVQIILQHYPQHMCMIILTLVMLHLSYKTKKYIYISHHGVGIDIRIPSYRRHNYLTQPINWRLMSWWIKVPGHQQPWYWSSGPGILCFQHKKSSSIGPWNRCFKCHTSNCTITLLWWHLCCNAIMGYIHTYLTHWPWEVWKWFKKYDFQTHYTE